MRVSPPATREECVLVFDASAPPDLDGLHAQALELVLRRAGLRTLTLTADLDPDRLAHALAALDPRVGRPRRPRARRSTISAAWSSRPAASAATASTRHGLPRRAPDTRRVDGPDASREQSSAARDGSSPPLDGVAGAAAPRARLAVATAHSARPVRGRHDPRAMSLVPGDPLAHRALESLLRAEATVRRRLSADLEREGISASGF